MAPDSSSLASAWVGTPKPGASAPRRLPATGWNEEPPKAPAWTRRLFGAVNALTVGETIDQGRRVTKGMEAIFEQGFRMLLPKSVLYGHLLLI